MSVIKPQEINLDFSQNSYKDIIVKQNDINSRTVIVTCTNNGVVVPIDYVSNLCHIMMKTPDGRDILNATTILSDGRIQIDFDEQMTLVSGKTIATLRVINSSSEEVIHTMNLSVIIVGNAISDDDIIAAPEFSALTEALMSVGDCTELVRSIEVIEANEETRKEEFEQMKAEIDAIPDGIVRVDFIDEEEVNIIPIERLNGISLYIDNENLMASWDNNGTTKEVNLSSGGGESSGFNDIYTETSINLGRKADTEIGIQSVAIGVDNTVVGINSMAIGSNNTIDETKFTGTSDYASNSIIVGQNNTIDCSYPTAILGFNNKVINSGAYSFYNEGGTLVAGKNNTVNNNAYHAVFGYNNQVNLRADGTNASYGCFVSGYGNITSGYYAVAIGYDNEAGGENEASIAIGRSNKSTGSSSVALGSYCEATGRYALASGYESVSSGMASIALGQNCEATGQTSVSIGYGNKATSSQSFAVGNQSTASGYCGIAMGYRTNAQGLESVAIGSQNEATNYQTLALGSYSVASGYNSIAMGYYAKASSNNQIALGKYNIEDSESKYAYIFGGGDYNTRKNIHTLDWNGNAWFSGSVTDGNGSSLSGIESSVDGIITTSFEGYVATNISGTYEQDVLEGYSLYYFYDRTETQNGVTVTFKDGTYSWTGTPTVSINANIYNIYFDELDLSLLTDGNYVYCKNCYIDVYDTDGNLLSEKVWKYQYNSTTVGKIIPRVTRINFSYTEGSAMPMIFQTQEDFSYDQLSIIPLEPYINGIPSPNPNYSQSIKFSSLSSFVLENKSGNTTVDFGEDIILYSTGGVSDTIVTTSINRNVAIVTLVGTEEISGDAEAGYFTYSPTIAAKAGSVNVLSDHYRNVNGDTSETDYNIFIDEIGNIRIQHSGFTSIDEYKTWLASNNVMIAYERVETEVIALSDEISTALKNLKVYSGKTEISAISSTIQPTIEIEYPTSKMGKYVLELLSIVKNLKIAEGGAY